MCRWIHSTCLFTYDLCDYYWCRCGWPRSSPIYARICCTFDDSIIDIQFMISALNIECQYWRCRSIHFSAEKSYCHTIHFRLALFQSSKWIRFRIVSVSWTDNLTLTVWQRFSIPVPDSQINGFPIAQFTVTNLSPTWVYCRQATHCQQGMVFAINPGDRFAAFQASAMGLNSTSTSPTTTNPSTVPGIVTSTATTANSPVSTSLAATDHTIIVGGPGVLAYQPSNITAQVGDTITFEFHEKNHTVTASSFATPCRALSSTSVTANAGFDSGL